MEARSAIKFIDEVPHYELAATELMFRDVQHDPTKPIYFHMKPYASRDMRQALSLVKAKSRAVGSKQILEDPDLLNMRPVFQKNFIRISNVKLKDGSEPTPKQQAEWCDRNMVMQVRIVSDHYTGVLLGDGSVQVEESADTSSFVIDIEATDAEVVNRYRLFSIERNENCEIRLTHHFKKESQADFALYRRATQRKEIDRRNAETVRETDYMMLESLYDRLVTCVEGVVVDGAACTEENKSEWVSLVPFWIKKVAVDQLFDETTLKNAR
jgi:hypothetical protein